MTDFDVEEQPLPALAKLKQLANDKGKAVGLLLRSFLVEPNYLPGGPHTVQTVQFLDPDFKPVDAEAEEDDEFNRVLREAEQAEREEQARKAREHLTELRDSLGDRSKGIGLDG